MSTDIERLRARILERGRPLEPEETFTFDPATPAAPTGTEDQPEQKEEKIQTPGVPLPDPTASSDVTSSNIPTIDGEQVDQPQPVSEEVHKAFYDVETDMLRPGASMAHRVNEQFFHGITDLSLDDPSAIKWDNQNNNQLVAFGKALAGGAVAAARGFTQTALQIGQATGGAIEGVAKHHMALKESLSDTEASLFERATAPQKAFIGSVLDALTQTPGGLDRTDFINEFNTIAQTGDSFALIDLAEQARGGEGLTDVERNQLVAQFEKSATLRQNAMDNLSYAQQQQMLKYTADKYSNYNVPFLYGRTDLEMDTEEFYRRRISEEAAEGNWGKAGVLMAGQQVAQLAPAIAAMMAGGTIPAVAKGAGGVAAAAVGRGLVTRSGVSVVGNGLLRFSPSILKTAPKSGLVMSMITPGTAEEKIKTGVVMSAYASSAAVSSLVGTWGGRWAADMALNSAGSLIMNPASEHMVEWGGMYREMWRQASYEADRLGLDAKNKNALRILYMAGVALPDAIFGIVAASSGTRVAKEVELAASETMAKQHWLRKEWGARLKQTSRTAEEREAVLDNSLVLMKKVADIKGQSMDEFFAENFKHDGDFGIKVFEERGEMVAHLESRKLDYRPQEQPIDTSKVDTNMGSPRAKALQELVVHQNGYDRPIEFEPAVVHPDAPRDHAEALAASLSDGDTVYRSYQQHPEFGRLVEDNNIKSYDELVDYSYSKLRDDIDTAMPMMGVEVKIHEGIGQPYRNMAEAFADIEQNRRLFITRSDPDHAKLGDSYGRDGDLTYADKLKALRVFFGHAVGGHDGTVNGIRNAQARVSQMLSDGGNLAFATEAGVVSSRLGHQQLGIRDSSNRFEDGTIDSTERPLANKPAPKAAMFGNEKIVEKRSVTALDKAALETGRGDQAAQAFARNNPSANPKLLAETYAYHSAEAARLNDQISDAVAVGDMQAMTDLAQKLINTEALQQTYREATETLAAIQGQPRTLSPDLVDAAAAPIPHQAAVLPPHLADWRQGLTPKPIAGTLEKMVPELLRPLKRKVSKNELAVTKKARAVVDSNNKNIDNQQAALDRVLSKYDGKDLSDKTNWENFWFDLTGETDIPVFPEGFRQILESGPKGVVDMVANLGDKQLRDVIDGIEMTETTRQNYADGKAKPETTALLSLWGALSPGLNNFPHESAFMEVVLGNGRIREFIQKAEKGTFDEAEYLAWVDSFYKAGDGKAGVSAKSNLNNFGKMFLKNFYKPIERGRYKGEKPITVLHRLLSDQDVTGKQIRREWYKLIDPDGAVGIDVKVLSFMSIMAGKRDVMVIDRVQTQHLWDMERTYGFKNGYDGIAKQRNQKFNKDGTPKLDAKGRPVLTRKAKGGMREVLTGHRALAIYEAFEKQLAPVVEAGFKQAGFPRTDLGTWHWMSWVAKSEQEVSHSSIQGLNRMMDGVDDPYIGASVAVGKFKDFFYGFKNTYFGVKGPDDFRHVYTTQDGAQYILDTQAMRDIRKVGDVYKGSASLKIKGEDVYVTDSKGNRHKVTEDDRIVPHGFKYTQENTANGTPVPTDRPWTERDDVNLHKFDRWVERVGVRPDARETAILTGDTDSTGIRAPGRGLEELKESGGVLAQEQPNGGLQGATAFFKNGQKQILLLKDADASTAHHEMFHALFDALPDQMKAQLIPALQDAGFEPNGTKFTPQELEAITRQYERFLFDGVAPTQDQQRMFSLIASQLRDVYRNIMGSPIRQEVHPVAKKFFDSLYAPDGVYRGVHSGHVQREEQELYGIIEAYDTQNGVTRSDPQDLGALAKDAGRLRHELGVEEVPFDVMARAASGLPVSKVSYRVGRKVYSRLLRSLLRESTPIDGAVIDDFGKAWVKSGMANGNRTMAALSKALEDSGMRKRDIPEHLAKTIERYVTHRAVPKELESHKRLLGQTAKGYLDFVKEATGPVQATRDARGFSESAPLKALSEGDLAKARREATTARVEDGHTNALGAWNKEGGRLFEGNSSRQTDRVRRDGHAELIPDDFRDPDSYFHSDTSLANSSHNGKPIDLYAYHVPTKQLIPAATGEAFELVIQKVPGAKESDFVRIDVSKDGDIVGTSGSKSGQVEAYSALRATDPNFRWVPDADVVPGFYSPDGQIVNKGQFSRGGEYESYVVYPVDKVDLFRGSETVAAAQEIMDGPTFTSWTRRVKAVAEPQKVRDFFTALDSTKMNARTRKRIKSDLMLTLDNLLGNDYLNGTNLEEILPGKGWLTQRNMYQAIDRGGSITDMVKHFNDLQDATGGKKKLKNLDLTEFSATQKKFVLGQSEHDAASEAARKTGIDKKFFEDLIENGEVRFPDDMDSFGAEQMIRMLIHVSKKTTGALKRAEAVQGPDGALKDKAARATAFRLATNARYAWNRLGAEVGRLDIGRRFGEMATANRRGSRNVETRFQTFFDETNIRRIAGERGIDLPSGKIGDQLYPLLRDKTSQKVIARWLGTEPSQKRAFAQAHSDFEALKPEFKAVGELIREELQGTSAAHLRSLKHYLWEKKWNEVRDEYMTLKNKKQLVSEDKARFEQLTRDLQDAAEIYHVNDAGRVEQVSVDKMLEVHNEFLSRDAASFHEYLKGETWGTRKNYWLTTSPEKYDKLLEEFTSRLSPLPLESRVVKTDKPGMPGSLKPRKSEKVELQDQNILNNLFQHMHRYEMLTATQRNADFLRQQVDEMKHLTPMEIKMLDRDIKNMQGFGDSLGPLQALIAKANRVFWKTYTLNTTRLAWYTVRNKVQPYALMASQFPITEIMAAVPEFLAMAKDPGSPLRKAFGDTFQSDIAESGAFARQALTDMSADVGQIKASPMGQLFDNFLNSALPFSDKLNRTEVYGLGWTIGHRAVRDFKAGVIDEAGFMKRTGLRTMDVSEQLDLMSMVNRGDYDAFVHEYAKLKNLNVNFAYRTGERALFLQDANTRTLASLSTWPLGASEIIIRQGVQPLIDGVKSGDGAMAIQGAKSLAAYIVGVYLVGETFSLVFGDKGGKAYHPVFSAISPSMESPGQGWMRGIMDDGIDFMQKMVQEEDFDKVAEAGKRLADRAMYMTPILPSLAKMYEAIADRKYVGTVDLGWSHAAGFAEGVADYMSHGNLSSETPDGLIGLIKDNIDMRMSQEGYSEYRTGWEASMHFILGTFGESNPERWDRSIVGETIMAAIEDAADSGRKFMDSDEWAKVKDKFKRTHDLDLDQL